MLEDGERDINEVRGSTSTAKFKTSLDYKRFIVRRTQANSENPLGWPKKKANSSGISFMATLYVRHLKDLDKSNSNVVKVALSVMQACVETRTNTAVNSKDATYCPKRLLRGFSSCFPCNRRRRNRRGSFAGRWCCVSSTVLTDAEDRRAHAAKKLGRCGRRRP
jgi:hypothetical protein